MSCSPFLYPLRIQSNPRAPFFPKRNRKDGGRIAAAQQRASPFPPGSSVRFPFFMRHLRWECSLAFSPSRKGVPTMLASNVCRRFSRVVFTAASADSRRILLSPSVRSEIAVCASVLRNDVPLRCVRARADRKCNRAVARRSQEQRNTCDVQSRINRIPEQFSAL